MSINTEFKPLPTSEFDIEKEEDTYSLTKKYFLTFYPTNFCGFTCFWVIYPLILFFFALFFGILPNTNWILPKPVPSTVPLNQFSEERVFQTINYLNSMGPKLIDSLQNKNATNYIYNQLNSISNQYRKSNVRVEIQYFNYDKAPFMNLRNIYARLSDSSQSPDLPSVMFSAHLDSAPFSPGASDDEMMISSLLEIYRILLISGQTPKNPIIFSFLNGEENGLYGSQVFVSNSSFWAINVQRFINLDATGSQGKSLLYRSYPSSVVSEYQGVPYPYANVIGEDIMPFIPSDTDFSAFINYTGGASPNTKVILSGMDMATFKDGFYYHTKEDTPEKISPGTVQQTGENLLYLANKYTFTEGILSQIPSTMKYVYFDTFGFFVYYPEWLQIVGNIFILFSIIFIPIFIFLIDVFNALVIKKKNDEKEKCRFLMEKSLMPCYYFVGYVFSIILGILSAVIVGLISSGLNSFSWYGKLNFGIFLYGIPTLFGLVLGQYVFFTGAWCMCYKKYETDQDAITQSRQRERFIGLLYVYILPIFLITVLRIRCGYFITAGAFFLLIGFLLCAFIELIFDYAEMCSNSEQPTNTFKCLKFTKGQIWILLPILSGLIPAIISWDMIYRILMLTMSIIERSYLPNGDVTIAVLISLGFIITFMFYLPFTHRGTNFVKIIIILLFTSIILLAVASFVPSFTPEYPQRFVVYNYGINDNVIDTQGTVKNTLSTSYTKIISLDQQNTPQRISQLYTDPRVQNFTCTSFICSFNTTFAIPPPVMTVNSRPVSTGTSYQFQIDFEPCNEVVFNAYKDFNLTNLSLQGGNLMDNSTYPLYSFYDDNPTEIISGSFIVPKGATQSILFVFNYWNLDYTPLIRDIMKNDTWAVLGPNNPRYLNLQYNYKFT